MGFGQEIKDFTAAFSTGYNLMKSPWEIEQEKQKAADEHRYADDTHANVGYQQERDKVADEHWGKNFDLDVFKSTNTIQNEVERNTIATDANEIERQKLAKDKGDLNAPGAAESQQQIEDLKEQKRLEDAKKPSDQQSAIPEDGAVQLASFSEDQPVQRPANALWNPETYLAATAHHESNNSNTAKNPNSSAYGKYQPLKGTWNAFMRKYPQLGLTPDGRGDPEQQDRFMRAYTWESGRALQRANIPVTNGTMYAAHLLGPAGATFAFKHTLGTPMSRLVNQASLNANPFLKRMSLGQFWQWAEGVSGGRRLTRKPAQEPAQEPAVQAARGGVIPTMHAASGGFLGGFSEGFSEGAKGWDDEDKKKDEEDDDENNDTINEAVGGSKYVDRGNFSSGQNASGKPMYGYARGGVVAIPEPRQHFALGGLPEEQPGDVMDTPASEAVPFDAEPVDDQPVEQPVEVAEAAPVAEPVIPEDQPENVPIPAEKPKDTSQGKKDKKDVKPEDVPTDKAFKMSDNPFTAAMQSTALARKTIAEEFRKQHPQTAIDDDPRTTQVLSDIANGYGAAPHQVMKRYLDTMDPDKKWSMSERNLRGMTYATKYYMDKGDFENAKKASLSALQYYQQNFNKFTAVAKAAAANGDVDTAMQGWVAAYANVPNGKDMHFKKIDEGHVEVSVTDQETGKVIRKQVASPDELGGALMQVDPGTFQKLLMDTGGVKGDTPTVTEPKDKAAEEELASSISDQIGAVYTPENPDTKLLGKDTLTSMKSAMRDVMTSGNNMSPEEAFAMVDPANTARFGKAEPIPGVEGWVKITRDGRTAHMKTEVWNNLVKSYSGINAQRAQTKSDAVAKETRDAATAKEGEEASQAVEDYTAGQLKQSQENSNIGGLLGGIKDTVSKAFQGGQKVGVTDDAAIPPEQKDARVKELLDTRARYKRLGRDTTEIDAALKKLNVAIPEDEEAIPDTSGQVPGAAGALFSQ